MLNVIRWTPAYGIVTLSAPRGNDYAWRTATGARVSQYARTVRDAETLFRVLLKR